MLGSRFPMMLGWGPDLLQFYNDAYVPVLGVKHPASLGAPVRVVLVGDLACRRPADAQRARRVGRRSGASTSCCSSTAAASRRRPSTPSRRAPCPATTARSAASCSPSRRRPNKFRASDSSRRCARSRSERAMRATTTEACVLGASVLAGADADVPFSLVYLPGRRRHAGDARRRRARRPSRAAIDLRRARLRPSGWPFREALRSGQPVPVDDLVQPLRFRCREGATASRRETAVVVPLLRDEKDRYGFVVFGLSPWRALSDGTWLPRASSRRSSPRRSRAPEPRRRSVAAPRPWPSSTAPRRCSSATSATSSARR